MTRTTKLYLWAFVFFGVLAAIMFWTIRDTEMEGVGEVTTFVGAVVALVMCLLFGAFSFVRFIRSRSIVGGLFLTVTVATGVFLLSIRFIEAAIAPMAMAFAGEAEAGVGAHGIVVGLAQFGLFMMWFLFLLFAIYLHIKPVKRIEKYLDKIADGEQVKKIHIGKSKQYKGLEVKLKRIADEVRMLHIAHREQVHAMKFVPEEIEILELRDTEHRKKRGKRQSHHGEVPTIKVSS